MNLELEPYIKYVGDRYFVKSWFGYKPADDPSGQLSDGAITADIPFKLRRGERVTVRSRGEDLPPEAIPGWGTVAANLKYSENEDEIAKIILGQSDIEYIFWVDKNNDVVRIQHACDV